ncbi:MAG: hypothetical protein JSS83_26875 [Cyanobacteria bacterium SZAS LIN-3]|nr:hypothetical protein [Cyanobacteria bacterium SZAS LIN-3]
MPFTMQAALASTLVGSTVQYTSSLTLAAPARRSTAKLSLVASNNWVRSSRSAARLSVVIN